MMFRNFPYWLFAFLVLTGLLTLWRLDVLLQPPYGSAATGLFTQASGLAHGDADSFATPAPTLYRNSLLPSALALLMKLLPSGPPLLVTFRVIHFGLGAVLALGILAWLRPRAGWGGGAIVSAAVLTAPILTVQMEIMNLDMTAVVLVSLASLLLLSGWGLLAALVGLLAALVKWTAVSYLAAGFLYSLVTLFIGGAKPGRGSLLAHAGASLLVLGWVGFQWDSAYPMGGWVPGADFGTSSLVDVWMWSPELLVLLGGLVVAVSALGDLRSSDSPDRATGFGYLDPPILFGGCFLLMVLGRLAVTGAVPAELAMLIPPLFLAIGWLAFSWPTYRPAALAGFFGLIAYQLVNSTGMNLPPLAQSIDFRTSALRERSREYLFTDHAILLESVKGLLEQGRDWPVATVPPMVHYLSLPALGYVDRPFEGYSLGGPTTPKFRPIEKLRGESPEHLAVVYLRNRYAANHDWTIPQPERGDEFLYPRTKERREQERWRISPVYVYKPREIPSESAAERQSRYLRRFWPSEGSLAKAAQLIELGRNQEAEIVLRQLLQGSPQAHAARYQLAALLEARQDLDSAKVEYERIPEGVPEYWQALGQRAMIELQQNRAEVADKIFADALAAYQRSAKQDPRSLSTLYLRWALADLQRGDLKQGEEKLRKATTVDPQFSLPARELGLVLYRQSQWAESLAQLEKAVELDREDPAVHFLLGAASARLGDWERARGSFVESLRLDPSNIEVQQSLAEALLKLRRYEEAAQEYDDALARVPVEEKGRRTNLLIGLADAQRGKGDWAGSIVTLRRAVDIEDESKEASNHLGWLLATAPDAEWRNGEEAVQLTQRFADNPNASAAFLDTLAAAYAETQQWDKGIAILERAIARAKEEGQASLEAECQRRLEMYRRQEPFRDQPEPR